MQRDSAARPDRSGVKLQAASNKWPATICRMVKLLKKYNVKFSGWYNVTVYLQMYGHSLNHLTNRKV